LWVINETGLLAAVEGLHSGANGHWPAYGSAHTEETMPESCNLLLFLSHNPFLKKNLPHVIKDGIRMHVAKYNNTCHGIRMHGQIQQYLSTCVLAVLHLYD
jgi:hypothetical protein